MRELLFLKADAGVADGVVAWHLERAAIDGSSVELFHNHASSIDWV